MGAVYEVEHIHTSEHLALKVIFSNAPLEGEALVRFRRESAAAARIKSEHVARVTDAGIDSALGGVAFLVMDLLEGSDLEAIASDIPQSPELVVAWLRQVAEGLSRAHALGLVHRDLKPSNLFLTKRADGTPLVKILDFGIVKQGDRELETSPTVTGAVLGTPLYMAPEQAGFETSNVTVRSDLYAVGLIAFRLLAGVSYRRADTVAKIIGEMASPTLASPSERGLELGDAFDAWFLQACAWHQHQRFASAAEQIDSLAAALRGARIAKPQDSSGAPVHLDSFVSAPTAVMPTPPALPTRKRPWSIPLAVGLVLVALGTGIVWARPRASSSPPLTLVADAATATSVQPKQLTDYPPPKTESPEALRYYQNAWRDSYDAVRVPQNGLARALELDPTFAAAHLRMAFHTWRPFSARSYAQALRYREKLGERDAALLKAYAPCEIPEQPDYDECLRNLETLRHEDPGDIEIIRLIAVLQMRRQPDGGVATLEELARLDPRMALGALALARVALTRGDDEEARRQFERCTTISPNAGLCILAQAQLQSQGGHCDRYAQGVRRVMVFDAENQFVIIEKLNAALSTDAPRAVVDQALTSFLQFRDGPEAAARYRGEVALWFGEMRRAYELLGQAETFGKARDNSVMWMDQSRLLAAEELGDESVLAQYVRAFIAERIPRTDQEGEEFFLRAMRQHHVVSEKEAEALRDRWNEARRADQGASDWQRWLAFQAVPAQNAEEARAALSDPAAAAIPASLSVDEHAELGRLYVLAGQPRNAIPHLEDAALSCIVFFGFSTPSRITSIMRSAYYLGQAREALGEREAACAAYALLSRRWGGARPRPVTAEAANKRSAALGCP